MNEQIDLSEFPPFSTVTTLRDGRLMNWNLQDYVAQPGDEIITVLRPGEREAVVPTR